MSTKSDILVFDEKLIAERDYWVQKLSPIIEGSSLRLNSTRHQPSTIEAVEIESFPVDINGSVQENLHRLTSGGPFLLLTTLMTALKVCLYKYSRDTAIAVGSPVLKADGQPASDNVLVIVDNIDDHVSFRDLLSQVRATLLDAYGKQNYPFNLLVQDLGLSSNGDRNPLFETALVLTDVHGETPELKNAITFVFSKGTDRVHGTVKFNSHLFDAEAVRRFRDHFLNVLRLGVADTSTQLRDLKILTAAEQHQLLVKWNATQADYPHDKCICDLFEAQVERTPAAVALTYGDEQLTYQELNRRANQLAHYLRSFGVTGEMLVAVLMDRSIEMVVALLGILKAGAAYLPLDPSNPPDRLSFMLADSGSPVLLTMESVPWNVEDYQGRKLCLDSDWPSIAGASAENPPHETSADNLCYVIYTSGSTGQPKGVSITQRAVSRLVFNTNYVQLEPGDCIAHVSNTTFDAATFEIWGALLHGARLCIISKDVAVSPHDFAEQLKAQKISVLFLTTALFNQIARVVPDAFNSLRYLLFGGEAVEPKWVREVLLNGPPKQLLHVYGPTENTTFSTWYRAREVAEGETTIPIGAPLTNTQAYVLDRDQQLVPAGVAGELCLGGDGLARGYLYRPELTAEKFIPHPFSDEPGARLYRTGDLVRYVAEGQIEFIGRIDHQVKVRGYRIELGEIEAALKDYAGVLEAVVIAREDLPGQKTLVAYVSATPQTVFTAGELRDFLNKRLPDYMIPAVFVRLDELPLTPSGKIDRKALPEPADSRTELEESVIAPRTPLEELVAGIWADILGLKRVGIHEDFFQIGGNSLLATQVVSRLSSALQVEIPLRKLFTSPTLAQLAESLEATIKDQAGAKLPAITPAPRDQESPLSFAQQRMWFLNQFDPENPFYNNASALRLTGQLDGAALQRTLDEIVRRHEVLRTTFSLSAGYPVQVIAPHEPLNIKSIDLSHLPPASREAEVQQMVRDEAQRPFDLTESPLLRATLLQLDNEEHVALVTMHHIASDGWSMGILIREVAALYEAFSKGEPSPLPELPIQYVDYAVWQRNRLQGEALEAPLAYWRQQLAGAPPATTLPTDRPRPKVQAFHGATISFDLSDRLRGLQELSNQNSATLFMTMLAAFQTLLWHYTGQDDILIGAPIANRGRSEIENVIGFFTNTLVLRTDLSGDPEFRELLARVREVALAAYRNQDVPFEMLVEELQPERSLSHTPLFQIAIIFQNMPMPRLELSGLTLTPIESDNGTAKFDLALFLTESEQGFKGTCEYDTDLFDPLTIQRLIGNFRKLLESIVLAPESRISTLPLLSDAEARQVLVEFNETASDFLPVECIHDLFIQQVERTPEDIAVVFGAERLTFREFNARANQFAHYLQSLGVGPESVVGLCMERSVEAVLALLGILKAGGAYVPLDPAYPAERLTFMLEDTRAAIIVTQQRLVDRLPEHQARVIRLDADWNEISQQSAQTPDAGTTTDNLAYVIYTSGSTGRPKGVAMCHRALINLIQWQLMITAVPGAAKNLQYASLSFDVSFQEMFTTWCSGASLVLTTEENRRDFESLLQLLTRESVARLMIPPVALYQLTKTATGRAPSSLREIIAAGEQLQVTEQLGDFFRSLPGCTLQNQYGPSESHIITQYTFTGSTRDWPMLPPIGKPVSNNQIYILDSSLQPVPIGVTGELYIGGVNLARGYFQRPDLTAERFIPNPFSSDPGARMYKSGDLSRFLPDGNIEFLGRSDSQVKVRGFRVELGEIEIVLSGHPAVREAVVITRQDPLGDRRLAAYVTLVAGAKTSVTELRDFLATRMPEYMVPSTFTVLERMPLTPSGKVARRLMPEVEASREVVKADFVAPRTALEKALVRMWSDVLEVSNIGINDNFFELGGHSLLATQLISQVREVFDVEIPLRTLFESPTVAGLAERIQAVRRGGRDEPPPSAIARVSRDQKLPLSFAQQRLWFLDQLEPDSPFYNLGCAIRLSGSLDVSLFERCFSEIVRRHEVLRTSFEVVEGQPVQVISPPQPLTIPVVELGHLLPQERETEAARMVLEELRRPFDLSQGPLIRASLLRLDTDEHILVLPMHHIVSDGWSLGVLVREMAALYLAYSRGEGSPLPELPIQYADFAYWQRQRLQGEELNKQLSYWKEQLKGASPVLELPTDYPRPPVPTFQGTVESFEIPFELTQSLNNLGRERGVTLFMTLLAAFQTLLARYARQDEIVVGCDIANRNNAAVEGLIGFFVNMLVMRTSLSGNPTFTELLERVHQTTLGAYAHQDLPFEQLVEVLQPERDLSRNPLFQVNFAFQNTPVHKLELPNLTLTPLRLGAGITRFDITLSMEETERGLSGAIVYSTDLFKTNTIRRMIGHFKSFLQGVVHEPDSRVFDVALLTEAERRQLLVDWNYPVRDYPPPLTIHQLFEAQVERTPDAVACVFDNQELTYRELNSKANQLAHHLQNFGVGPEVPVGVCMERSLEMVIGLLGILKSGGAYVPLDPEYPKERLTLILDDTLVPVVLTQQAITDRLPVTWTTVIRLDTDWAEIAGNSNENTNSEADSANLAYIIYTSGSTGKPKGAMLHHAGVCHRLRWGVEDYQLGPGDSVLNKTVLSFDVSVWEIFAPLICGARLVVAVSGGQQDSAYLLDLMSAQKVTHADFVPSMLHVFLEEKNLEGGRHLKRITAAGEALTVDMQRRFFARLDADLYNLYGPTEASLAVTYWACERDDHRRVVPIGQRMDHARIYILDKRMQPVPCGVAGEIYIGGVAVGRGYLNRPELTAEIYVADPFSLRGGERLYRTGDLGRYLEDGNIEFLGRVDHQVKVRGFRIELGEIEALLGGHPAVNEAVVLAREDAQGDKRLVAYIVPSRDSQPTPGELQTYLREALPEYMVPAAYVTLESIPLTPNGKADRNALPAPDMTDVALETFVAPRNDVETMLADIWSDVLRLERVGINDNFFSLGGHSLLATQVIGRIREVFEVEIPLRNLFQSPSIAELAVNVGNAIREVQGVTAPPIRRVERDSEIPLSFAQQRLWFIDQLEPNSAAYNIPMAVRLTGLLDTAALERTLNEIVRRHETLRTTFNLHNGQPVQVINNEVEVQLQFNDLSALPPSEREAKVRQLAREEAQLPFDLLKGPLLRATLLKTAEEEHVALLTMHHIVSDGWSAGVFVREVVALYQAFARGEAIPLAELPIQYADFAHWQREWLRGEALEKQLSYWKQQLAGAPTVLNLPTDRSRSPVRTTRGAYQEFKLSEALSAKIKDLNSGEGTTLFMFFLAAFQILLSRYSGQDDVLVGTPIANRNRTELEDLIGFFANTLVLRTDLSSDPVFRELLSRVRKSCLEAYAHEDLPFERLVQELHLDRDMSRTPLFQVMLVMQNASREKLVMPGLELEVLELDSETAKFDLTMSLVEGEQQLSGALEYNTDLFNASTITRMLKHFETLLEDLVADPDQRLSELTLLDNDEERRLLVEWNNTLTSYPRDSNVPALFEAQVELNPNGLAVVFGDERITYGELNRRANQLAHYLQARGVGPEVPVGLFMERSPEMLIALLGILKAGGAYVPLDPDYPLEWLSYMMNDARLALVVTHEHLRKQLPSSQAPVIAVDSEWPAISEHNEDNPSGGIDADNLAYIMYTSGSTGMPKGVTVTHRNIIRLVKETDYADFGAGEVFLMLAPISFDASTFEVWGSLLNGARLVVMPPERPALEDLSQALRDHGVTTLWLTAGLFHLMADERLESFRGLRQLLAGGDVLNPAHVRKTLDTIENGRVINGYGPTECTTFACCHPMSKDSLVDKTAPIGRPIANTEVYILDEQMRPVPPGIDGEIYIGGDGVARGYLNQPELTAEKFVPHPFNEASGARLYRTGDVAHYQDDGTIEFVGRRDQQVKVRGYRIETGEVELALVAHAAIREAVVTASGNGAGGKRLVAYVVPENGDLPAMSELREFLLERLPEYMVPSTFVSLPKVPLTHSGKVDRQALPEATENVRPELGETFVTAETDIEKLIAGIWQDVLHVDQVGIYDNFFDLGGHSLLIIQVQEKIRQALDQPISVVDLFRHPTINAIARHLSHQEDEAPSLQKSYTRAELRLKRLEQSPRSKPKNSD